jgi:phosphoglycerate dehydrogenase-like enzyme
MMTKLLILSRDAKEYKQLIGAAHLPDLQFATDPEESDIVLGEPKLVRDMLPSLSTLKWVQAIYAGVEPLVDPSQRRDYILTNARGVFGKLMSEYVFGYLLFHEKKILERIQNQQAKQWERSESGVLRGKTLGLLGVGSIGAHLAGTAKHFGMKVRGFTRESEESKQVDQYFHPSPQPSSTPLRYGSYSPTGRGGLMEFADGLDYLVCVLPKTKDTNKIVEAKLLNALPPQAIFVNVGRGNAVDESALVDALNEGKLAAAVLDVFEKEPLPADHPFWTTPNLFMTFHTSAISYPEDITRLFIENYRLYIEGQPLKYVVDFERGY